MKGHLAILNLRLRGLKPSSCAVYVCNTPPRYYYGWDHPENAINNNWMPSVDIEPDDNIVTLDLRFLQGMRVSVTGIDDERTLAVFNHVVSFSPDRVASAIGDAIMWYSPDRGVVDLCQQQGD